MKGRLLGVMFYLMIKVRKFEFSKTVNIYTNKERKLNMKANYLTITEIAEMLKVSYDTALNFVKYSNIDYVKIGRQYRVEESKLNAVLYPEKAVKRKLCKRPIYQIIERTG